ncbi:hypothetical protein SCANM63S_07231 [Streptomyces canarius]
MTRYAPGPTVSGATAPRPHRPDGSPVTGTRSFAESVGGTLDDETYLGPA